MYHFRVFQHNKDNFFEVKNGLKTKPKMQRFNLLKECLNQLMKESVLSYRFSFTFLSSMF